MRHSTRWQLTNDMCLCCTWAHSFKCHRVCMQSIGLWVCSVSNVMTSGCRKIDDVIKTSRLFFAPSGRGPQVSNSAPLTPPPSYLAYIFPLFFTQAFYFSRRTIKPPVLCCFHRPWDGSLVSETWLPFTVHFVCILGDSGLDSDGEDGAKVNHMLAKAAQQTHIITEGTAASHGCRIKCEILFFIKFPQLCTVHMRFHPSAHLHTVLSWL